MLKLNELKNPASCINRAKDCEMTFVLLARDVAAPIAIRAWADSRLRLGKNTRFDPQIVEALRCADFMEAQQIAGLDCPKPLPIIGDVLKLADGQFREVAEVSRLGIWFYDAERKEVPLCSIEAWATHSAIVLPVPTGNPAACTQTSEED